MEYGESEVGDFFKRQRVLLTGATGFLGKVAVEKLLRCASPEILYLLVRSKKGSPPQERIQALFQESVFERLRREVPDFMSRVRGVAGDVSAPGLGLSQEDWTTLVEEVTTVIHGAATVRFDENIQTSVLINVRGTKELVKLAQQMKQLKVLTYISTAFAHCTPRVTHMAERFCDSPIEPDFLIKLAENISRYHLAILTPFLIEDWPNTYAYSKAVTEEVIKRETKGLKVAIFRPAIVIGALEEPEKGWCDNLYGATGVLVGAGAGVMRTLLIRGVYPAELVPVDLSVNAMITLTYQTAIEEVEEPKIVNYTSSKHNCLTWNEFMNINMKWGLKYPPISSLYYITFTFTANPTLYWIYSLLMQAFPSLLFDLYLILTFQKPRVVQLNVKIHRFSKVLEYFTCSKWDFCCDNILQLMKSMSKQDKHIFNPDISCFSWDDFFKENVMGLRKHIFKESEDSLPEARARMFRLSILHRSIQAVCVVSLAWLLRGAFF